MPSRALLVAALSAAAAAAPHHYDYDVVVYGATPNGICAAVAAAEGGKRRVALAEPLPLLGGVFGAGGFGLPDDAKNAKQDDTGFPAMWARKAGEAYGYANETARPVYYPDIHVGRKVFEGWLADANVTVSLNTRIVSVAKSGTRITSVTFNNGTTLHAPVFVDSSNDGDLMIAAGCDHTYGRESKAQYGEAFAGVQQVSKKAVTADPFLNDSETVIPFVESVETGAWLMANPGAADASLLAHCLLACVSTDADRVPFPKMDGYNADDFIGFIREAQTLGTLDGGLAPFTNLQAFSKEVAAAGRNKFNTHMSKAALNNDVPYLTNVKRGSWANANYSTRAAIIKDMQYYTVGMLYTLANDERVPEAIRKQVRKYGLCADEFVEFGHMPISQYNRGSNRMIGDYVLTQNNMSHPAVKSDSVAVNNHFFEPHAHHTFARKLSGGKAEIWVEGGHMNATWVEFDVPLRAVLPKRSQVTNLLVSYAISQSAVVQANARLENYLMELGGGAGVCARQLADDPGMDAHDIDMASVQQSLTNEYRQKVHAVVKKEER